MLAAGWLASPGTADVIRFKGGHEVEGTVLKRNDRAVWLDVGPQVLEFSLDDIEEIEVADSETVTEAETGSLFHTARSLPQRSALAQAKRGQWQVNVSGETAQAGRS